VTLVGLRGRRDLMLLGNAVEEGLEIFDFA
jgi:hypothetical protein